jgi:hypothetical protein
VSGRESIRATVYRLNVHFGEVKTRSAALTQRGRVQLKFATCKWIRRDLLLFKENADSPHMKKRASLHEKMSLVKMQFDSDHFPSLLCECLFQFMVARRLAAPDARIFRENDIGGRDIVHILPHRL